MTATTHSSFGGNTEALEVAAAFPKQIQGKTVLVTGVNQKGIGFTTAQAFASQAPAHLIIATRNLAKIEESIDVLKSEFPAVDYRPLQLNLSSQKDVRAAAKELLSWDDVPTIDIVVNSAGIAFVPERHITEDGIELAFATNHIGHFLFASLIMPKLIKAAEASSDAKGATRIINVSSLSALSGGIRWSDQNFDKVNKDLPADEQPDYDVMRAWGSKDPELQTYLPLESYSQSKIANVLFSIGLNKRLYEKHGILSLAVHPGVIQTELARNTPPEVSQSLKHLFDSGVYSWKTQGAGSSTSLVAAVDPALSLPEMRDGKENVGVYFIDCQISDKPDPRAVSAAQAEKLWARSEELVKQQFVW